MAMSRPEWKLSRPPHAVFLPMDQIGDRLVNGTTNGAERYALGRSDRPH
jgi:hypothetical protein